MKRLFPAFLILMLVGGPALADQGQYLVKIPPPETLYLTPDIDTFPKLYEGDHACSFSAWAYTMQSLSGLAALHALEHGGNALVWIHSPGLQSYTIILEDILARTGAAAVHLPDLESVISLGVDAGWVNGYIVYGADESERNRYDKINPRDPLYSNSVNAATSLAADLGAVLVEARAEPVFQAMGLEKLMDVRDKDEQWCFDNHRERFNRKMIHTLDPKAPHMRDYVIATRSLCVFGVVPFVDEALAWLEPNAPAMGWNAGDEFEFVAQLSRFAHFTTASNWIMNLPVMSCLRIDREIEWEELQVNRASRVDPLLLDWPADTHFTSFVLSDGDNIQWFTGNFASPPNAYWRAENRGAFPFGWTMPAAHLSQICPSMLHHLARTASPNDQALTFPDGYYYPDFYGHGRDTTTDWYGKRVDMFAERLGMLGIRAVINIAQGWESEGAMHAYRTYAEKIPNIAGILAMQYHPYNAGLGAIRWVEDASGMPVPVVPPRFSIWSGLSRIENNGPPALVADKINRQAYEGYADTDAYFDWTVVHAWSHFRQADTGDDLLAEEMDQQRPFPEDAVIRNGYEPAGWCVDRLAPHVRVVLPEELLWRIRLQLKTRETLKGLVAARLKMPDTPPWQQQLLEVFLARLAQSPLDSVEACRAAFLRLQDIHLGRLLVPDDLPEDLGEH